MAGATLAGTLQSPYAAMPELDPTEPGEQSPPVLDAVLELPVVADTVFIGVSEAAGRLGIHANTVRNWIDRGLLSAIRLPGSRHRRISQADVERVRQSLLGQLASPALAGGSEQEFEARAPQHGEATEGFQGEPHEGW